VVAKPTGPYVTVEEGLSVTIAYPFATVELGVFGDPIIGSGAEVWRNRRGAGDVGSLVV